MKEKSNNENAQVSEATAEEIANHSLKLNTFDIWCTGITIVIGGQYFSFNAGYSAGFGSFAISTVLIGCAYTSLCFCNAEISSALPFAGGAYGIARVSLGMYAGFIVGCLEAIEYIIYVAVSAAALCNMIISVTNTSNDMFLVYCLAFYLSALAIHIPGGLIYWRTNKALAIVSIGLILIFVFGSIPYSDFNVNAPLVSGIDNSGDTSISGAGSQYFIGGFVAFYAATPLAAWFYVGVESLNLCAAFVEKPRVTIGKGSVSCILTLFATSIGVLFVCASVPAYIFPVAITSDPLNSGYQLMFQISSDAGTILTLPATYATAFGFIFAYGRVIIALSKSGLFPPIFTRTFGKYQTPYVALIVGSVIGYTVCVLQYFSVIDSTVLFNVCILHGFMAYISQLIGFLLFRIRHASQERLYTSHLGYTGAVYGIIVFSLSSVSIMGFQGDDSKAFIIFLCIIAILTVYYFLYAKKRQKFSVEEKFIFVLQIVKFNQRARRLATRGPSKTKKNSIFQGFLSNKSSQNKSRDSAIVARSQHYMKNLSMYASHHGDDNTSLSQANTDMKNKNTDAQPTVTTRLYRSLSFFIDPSRLINSSMDISSHSVNQSLNIQSNPVESSMCRSTSIDVGLSSMKGSVLQSKKNIRIHPDIYEEPESGESMNIDNNVQVFNGSVEEEEKTI